MEGKLYLPIWARLINLPIEFFHPDILRAIGFKLDKMLRIDTITTMIARGSLLEYVQVDLAKPPIQLNFMILNL